MRNSYVKYGKYRYGLCYWAHFRFSQADGRHPPVEAATGRVSPPTGKSCKSENLKCIRAIQFY